MIMSVKQTFIAAVSALLLTIGGVFVLNEAQAQQVCGRPGDSPCSSGLVCVSNRCNLPPPIWDARSISTSQNASIFLRGTDATNSLRVGNLQLGLGNQFNSGGSCGTDAAPANCEIALNFSSVGSPRVGRGLTIYDGQATDWFRIDRGGLVRVRRGLSIGSETPNAADGELRAATGRFTGALSADTVSAATGTITGGLNVGGSPVVTRPASCAAAQVLQWSGSAWRCAAQAVNSEADPQFTGWRGADPGAARTLSDLVINGDLTVRGSVLMPTGGTFVDSVNLDTVIRQPIPCAADQYLQWTGSAWRCATVALGPGGVADETDPVFDSWRDTGPRRLTDLTIIGAFTAGSVNTPVGGGVTTTALTAASGTISGALGVGSLTVGGSAVIREPGSCPVGQYLRRTDGGWECAIIGVAGPESDPVFDDWRTTGPRTLADLSVTGALTAGAVAGTTVNAAGCFGPTFVGLTSATTNGSNGGSPGYVIADDRCSVQFAGSHVCSTSEILNSKSCDAPVFNGRTSGIGWILNGPPGFPANSNDCGGRSSASADDFGSIWAFSDTGGQGLLTPCNTARALACCR